MIAGRQLDLHLDGLTAEVLPVTGERRGVLLIVSRDLHLLLVDPESDGHRIRALRPQATEDDAHHVLAFDRDAVHGVEGVRQAQPGDVVRRGDRPRFDHPAALRAEAEERRLHGRWSEERHPRDAARRRDVLLHQDGRERQHVGDVVEPVPGIVLREVVGRPDVDAEQFLDRVVVLGAVEAARGHPARIGRRSGVDTLQLAREPRRDGLALLLGRLFLFERGHLAAAQLADDLVPLVAMFDERRARGERLKVEVVLLLLVPVAGEAVLGEERFDDGIEAGRRRGPVPRASPPACPGARTPTPSGRSPRERAEHRSVRIRSDRTYLPRTVAPHRRPRGSKSLRCYELWGTWPLRNIKRIRLRVGRPPETSRRAGSRWYIVPRVRQR